jgi:methionyl-tRNA formyltransferase
MSPSPVKAAALELGLPVTDDLAEVTECGAELGVVVAYGRIVPAAVLAVLPMVNLHFSLLPRWRGAAPVERALLAGDPVTGVCVMEVAEGLDTGGVYASERIPIGDRETAESLRLRLVEAGSTLLVETLDAGLGEARPQDESLGVTYAHKIGPDDLRLSWDRSATELDRLVRIGGAWTTFRGKRLKVLEGRPVQAEAPCGGDAGVVEGTVVGCGLGRLALIRVQPEGRPPMRADDWANGAQPTGERLE